MIGALYLGPLHPGQSSRGKIGQGLSQANLEVVLALEEHLVDVGVEELEADPLVRLGQLQQVAKRHPESLCVQPVAHADLLLQFSLHLQLWDLLLLCWSRSNRLDYSQLQVPIGGIVGGVVCACATIQHSRASTWLTAGSDIGFFPIFCQIP